MPLRILRVRGLINASLIRGFLVTGMYSTFFLATLYLEQVRHFSALETGAAFLPWTLTVAVLSQGVTARLVTRFGPLPVLTTGMAIAAAGLLLFATVGPDTAYFPTIFVANFAIGLGIGNAFMPLLTLAMADVPAADAGLGSGITNVSQQISGALGLAVLSTVAANHTQGLLSDGNGLTSSSARRLPRRLRRRRRRDPRRDRPRRGLAAAARSAARPRPTHLGGTSRMTPADSRRLRLVSDAVIANYILDLGRAEGALSRPLRADRSAGDDRDAEAGRHAAPLLGVARHTVTRDHGAAGERRRSARQVHRRARVAGPRRAARV